MRLHTNCVNWMIVILMFSCMVSLITMLHTQPLGNMTLPVWYNIVSGTYNEGENSDDSSTQLPRFQLQNNLGTIVHRRHQACLRVPIMTSESLGDDYNYHLFLLYFPWSEETLKEWHLTMWCS